MTDQPTAPNRSAQGQERTPGTNGQQDLAVIARDNEGQRSPGTSKEGQNTQFVHPSRRGGNAR